MDWTMTDPSFLLLWQTQGQLVRDLAETCKLGPDGQRLREQGPRILQDLTRLYEVFDQIYSATWAQLEADALEDEETAGLTLQSIVESLLGDFESARYFLTFGPTGDLEATFEKSLVSLRRMSEELAGEWPWLDREMIRQAQAEHAQGHWEEAGDILRAMQSSRSENP